MHIDKNLRNEYNVDLNSFKSDLLDYLASNFSENISHSTCLARRGSCKRARPSFSATPVKQATCSNSGTVIEEIERKPNYGDAENVSPNLKN
jgi:hypothetical protein